MAMDRYKGNGLLQGNSLLNGILKGKWNTESEMEY